MSYTPAFDSPEQRQVLDALPVLVFLERAGRIVFANSEARRRLQMPEVEWAPQPAEQVLWGLSSGIAEPQTMVTAGQHSQPFHATLAALHGPVSSVEGIYSWMNPARREAIIVAQVPDREPAPRLGLIDDVLASLPEAVAIVCGAHVLYVNPAFTQMFGYATEEAAGRELRDLIVPPSRWDEDRILWETLQAEDRVSIETIRVNKQGSAIEIALGMAPLRVKGSRAGYILTFREIVRVAS